MPPKGVGPTVAQAEAEEFAEATAAREYVDRCTSVCREAASVKEDMASAIATVEQFLSHEEGQVAADGVLRLRSEEPQVRYNLGQNRRGYGLSSLGSGSMPARSRFASLRYHSSLLIS